MKRTLFAILAASIGCATSEKSAGGSAPMMCTPCVQPCTAYPGCKEDFAEARAAKAAAEKAAAEKAAAEKAAAEKAAAEKAAAEKAAAEQAAAEKAAAEKAAADRLAAEKAAAEALAKDSDGDGVPDREDNCPNEAGPASNHGCPEAKKQLVVVTATGIQILQKVQFAPGKAAIQPASFKLLDQVAAVLEAHPELKKIEVQGHTDNSGNAAANHKLSQARAEAVVARLVKAQIDAGRLSARGYGPDAPIADNKTRDGREANRRVEFKVAP